MKAYQLADQPGSSATLPGLAQLIDLVGDDAFAPSLLKSVFSLTRPDHLTAFSFAGDAEPRVIFAENTGVLLLMTSPANIARIIGGTISQTRSRSPSKGEGRMEAGASAPRPPRSIMQIIARIAIRQPVLKIGSAFLKHATAARFASTSTGIAATRSPLKTPLVSSTPPNCFWRWFTGMTRRRRLQRWIPPTGAVSGSLRLRPRFPRGNSMSARPL